jgi:enamine deaminase RidA (YjgF/YER057c/UK114 family)
MEKTAYQPETMHKPFANYSHVIAVEGAKRMVFCAGQVSAGVDGAVVGEGDFDAQKKQVMANLRDALAAAGAGFADVVKVTIYVVRQEDTPKGRELLAEYFGGCDPPTASTLCVLQGLANPKFLLEVEATAVL